MGLKLSKILPFITPFIAIYLIFSLGWESQIREDINALILLGMVFILSILHLIILLDRSFLLRKQRKTFLVSFGSLFVSLLSISTWSYLENRSLLSFYETFIEGKVFLIIGLIVYILIRMSQFMQIIYTKIQNPAFIFAISFAFLIFLGTLLLMLPDTTIGDISFIDTLFTATSAVCVTGLVVVDISKEFTLLGQSIIMVLIQLGGIGILTITSFFSYFFKNVSFREGLHMKSLLSTDSLGNISSLAAKIVLFTFAIESLGALLIYASLDKKVVEDKGIFFSIFHAISAFCNAGFSTLSNGLYSLETRYNYQLQSIILFLLITGGLGFHIVFNFYYYLWLKLKKIFSKIFMRKYLRQPIHVITLNARISILTTLALLFAGTIFYFLNEYHNALAEHKGFLGKLAASFFSSASPRTAGFNVVSLSSLMPATIFFTMLLMWIGASPASTGGGIKTSTFALSLLNIFSLIRGKDYLEVFGKEISLKSLRHAFAIIALSFMAIGMGFFIILKFDPQINGLAGLFEVFSAFSTAGLSLGITSELSSGSKLVLIILMLLGRIGLFNLLLGIFQKLKTQHHRYPKEDILIN